MLCCIALDAADVLTCPAGMQRRGEFRGLLQTIYLMSPQQGVIEADIAINTFAAPEDRERIRIAVTETGVIDWRDK